MFRIWAKTLKNGKITRQYVYENTEKLDYSRFFDYVREMCEHMDIPTPVIIKTHLFNYAKFNTVSFSSQDFMEKPDFDKLVLENAHL